MSYLGFNKLQSKIEAQGKSPAAAAGIAAAVGRSKYGARAMSKAASTGTPLKGAKVRKKKRTKVRPKGY